MTAIAREPRPPAGLDDATIERLDDVVARSRAAADAFRRIDDQETVDRIVWSLVVAGLQHAVDLARLAMDEVGFGVFEDKVIKNYIATEFLYDYLKDKRSVGMIDEDVERAIRYVAEPVGVVLALTPITNPTSTILFKAIVAAKTRNAIVFRPSARAAGCSLRAVEILREAGERAGMPQDALQVIPDPTLDVSQYLFHHPDVDFIWTTGGPKAVAAANAAGKPCLSVGAGNAPVYIHRSADVPMAAVDMLISKTFDASLICPAEQTVIVDEPIWDETLDELQRLGARLLSDDEVSALAAASFDDDGHIELSALGQSCAALAGVSGFSAHPDDKVLLAPLPSDLDGLRRHPLVHEKLMPVLGVVRSPDPEHAVHAAEVVLEDGGHGTHVGGLRDRRVRHRHVLARDQDRANPRQRPDRRRRARRRLQRHDAHLLARLRDLGRLGHHREHQLPKPAEHQGGLASASAAAVVPSPVGHILQRRLARRAPSVLDGDTRSSSPMPTPRRAASSTRSASGSAVPSASSRGSNPSRPRADPHRRRDARPRAPELIVAVGGGSVLDAAKAMRLFHESPELTLEELTLPFLDARKRVAHYPDVEHAIRFAAVPTTAGTGSEVSPAAVLTAGGRKLTLVDYSLVPDVAIVDPRLTITMPPHMTADTGIDALTHALEAGVSIFASPYTDAFCMQALHLILDALPRAYADGADLTARTAMSNAATLAGLAFSNAFVGVNHALAHAVGARFGIAHGRANAIFLPHVLRYNAALATQVHAGARLHDLRRTGQVRADGVGARSRRTECRRAP